MAKTLIDLDEVLLGQARVILGTSTKRDTVNAALREVVRRRLIDSHIEHLKAGELPDLLDPDISREAWR